MRYGCGSESRKSTCRVGRRVWLSRDNAAHGGKRWARTKYKIPLHPRYKTQRIQEAKNKHSMHYRNLRNPTAKKECMHEVLEFFYFGIQQHPIATTPCVLGSSTLLLYAPKCVLHLPLELHIFRRLRSEHSILRACLAHTIGQVFEQSRLL